MSLSRLEWFDRLTELYLGASPDKRYAEGRQQHCIDCKVPITCKTQSTKPRCWRCYEERIRQIRLKGRCLDCNTGIDIRSKRCLSCSNKFQGKNLVEKIVILSPELVAEIRKELDKGGSGSNSRVAKMFGVSRSTITRIKSGGRW